MRQVLRIPTSPLFRDILNDDHEWLVLTDLRLNPLTMRRGGKTGISRQMAEKAYEYIKKKAQPGKTLMVYDLHTHPNSEGLIPSKGDITNFIAETLIDPFKVKVMGHGIITKKGIFLVKIKGNNEDLIKLYRSFGQRYDDETDQYLTNKVNKITPEYVEKLKSGEITRRKRSVSLPVEARMKSFNNLVKEEPSITTKTVRRSHMGRLRRR